MRSRCCRGCRRAGSGRCRHGQCGLGRAGGRAHGGHGDGRRARRCPTGRGGGVHGTPARDAVNPVGRLGQSGAVDIRPRIQMPDGMGRNVVAVEEADLPHLPPICVPAVPRHGGKGGLAVACNGPAKHNAVPNTGPRALAAEQRAVPPGNSRGGDAAYIETHDVAQSTEWAEQCNQCNELRGEAAERRSAHSAAGGCGKGVLGRRSHCLHG